MYKKMQHKFSNRMKYVTLCAIILLTIVGVTVKKERKILETIVLEMENTSCQEELENEKLLVEEWDDLNPSQNGISEIEGLIFSLKVKKIDDIDKIDEKQEEIKEEKIEKVSNKKKTNEEEIIQNQDESEVVQESEPKVQETMQLVDADYDTLVRIVEAEATGEDIKGKILVANVILNRVEHESFPNSVKAVVFETCGGSPQFSPTADGRFDTVEVTEESKEAVRCALVGEDYSNGALYFSARSRAEPSNMSWFDRNLKWLFKYGGHEFYALKN